MAKECESNGDLIKYSKFVDLYEQFTNSEFPKHNKQLWDDHYIGLIGVSNTRTFRVGAFDSAIQQIVHENTRYYICIDHIYNKEEVKL